MALKGSAFMDSERIMLRFCQHLIFRSFTSGEILDGRKQVRHLKNSTKKRCCHLKKNTMRKLTIILTSYATRNAPQTQKINRLLLESKRFIIMPVVGLEPIGKIIILRTVAYFQRFCVPFKRNCEAPIFPTFHFLFQHHATRNATRK